MWDFHGLKSLAPTRQTKTALFGQFSSPSPCTTPLKCICFVVIVSPSLNVFAFSCCIWRHLVSQSHCLGLAKVSARMLLRGRPVLRHSLPTAECQELLHTPTSNAGQPKSACVGQRYRLSNWPMSPTMGTCCFSKVTHLVIWTVVSLFLLFFPLFLLFLSSLSISISLFLSRSHTSGDLDGFLFVSSPLPLSLSPSRALSLSL